MSSNRIEPLDIPGLLRLSQQQWPGELEVRDAQINYRELLRYTLQLAVEREAAAEVLAELRKLLEEYAPPWYLQEQHERVDSTLALLDKL